MNRRIQLTFKRAFDIVVSLTVLARIADRRLQIDKFSRINQFSGNESLL